MTLAPARGDLVIPGCGQWLAEQAPEEMLATLTACRARSVTDR
jgi:hypothetical protein